MTTPKHKLTPNLPVADSARIVLASLLRRVQKQLEFAAKFSDEDIEHVHRLRISTRRTIAAIDVFREFLPAKRRQKIVEQLTEIRNAAGAARDLDVLIESQTKSSKNRQRKLVKQLRKDRKKAQSPIVMAYQQSRRNKSFWKDCQKLLKALDRINSDDQPCFSKWANQKLAIYVSRFFSQRPTNMSDLRQLHRFRIEAKKFRYVLNVLEPALPSKALKKVKPQFRLLQDELGKINDHAVAISRIRKLKSEGIKIHKRVAKKEKSRLDASIRQFTKWWTKESANSIKNQFQLSETPPK